MKGYYSMITLFGLTISTLAFGIFQSQSFRTENLIININSDGQVDSIYDIAQEKQYFPEGQSAPLLSIAIGEKVVRPKSMVYNEALGQIKLHFGNTGIIATIKVCIKPTHRINRRRRTNSGDVGSISDNY
jgi:hypothetical protein